MSTDLRVPAHRESVSSAHVSDNTEARGIPSGWRVCRLGDAMVLVNGRAFKQRDWGQLGLPIIRIQNLNDPQAELNYYAGPADPRHIISAGDLVFAWSGTTGTSFGARIWSGPPGILNQHIFKVLTDNTQLAPHFGLLVLQQVQFDIEKRAHGFKASFVHVRKSDLVQIALRLPPIDEQRAIVAALSEVDALIGALDKLIAKKRAMRLAAMQQLLTGKTRLPGFNAKWDAICIKQITSPCTDRNATGAALPVLTCSKHLGFIDSLGYFKNQVFSRDLRGYKLIRRGQLGYPANHIEEGSIGFQNTYDVALVSPIYVVFSPVRGVNGYFLHRLLKLESYRQRFATATNASVDRRGSLKWPAFSQIGITLPHPEEQKAIAAVLEDMDDEITALERRGDKAKAIKQGMMQTLLPGRVRLVGPQPELQPEPVS